MSALTGGVPRRGMAVAGPSLEARLAARGLDATTLLVLPAALFVVALFVYPFLYGLVLSFYPKEGGVFANYIKFFSDPVPVADPAANGVVGAADDHP